MRKSDINPLPEFFDRYINLVPEEDLLEALDNSRKVLDNLDLELFRRIGQQVYAPGKWTLNDLFQHMADTERIMSYRALTFGRNDHTPLPGFEENDYAENTIANHRVLKHIIHELKLLRETTIILFDGFTEDMLKRTGIANNIPVTVGSIGFMIAGHQIHHMNVIKERYSPLG